MNCINGACFITPMAQFAFHVCLCKVPNIEPFEKIIVQKQECSLFEIGFIIYWKFLKNIFSSPCLYLIEIWSLHRLCRISSSSDYSKTDRNPNYFEFKPPLYYSFVHTIWIVAKRFKTQQLYYFMFWCGRKLG